MQITSNMEKKKPSVLSDPIKFKLPQMNSICNQIIAQKFQYKIKNYKQVHSIQICTCFSSHPSSHYKMQKY